MASHRLLFYHTLTYSLNLFATEKMSLLTYILQTLVRFHSLAWILRASAARPASAGEGGDVPESECLRFVSVIKDLVSEKGHLLFKRLVGAASSRLSAERCERRKRATADFTLMTWHSESFTEPALMLVEPQGLRVKLQLISYNSQSTAWQSVALT